MNDIITYSNCADKHLLASVAHPYANTVYVLTNIYIMCVLLYTTSSVKKNFVRFLDAFLVMCAGDALLCICILFARTYPDDFHERIGQEH